MIRRACTYSVAITTPIAPSEYAAIEVTFAQDQEIVLSKTKDELTLSDEGVLVELTQEETKQFLPSIKSPMGERQGGKVFMQIRAYTSMYDAPGSDCWSIDVADSLNTEVLPNA